MVWNFVKRITPLEKSRDLNLALLDFGAIVCTAKKPKCASCTVSKICPHMRKWILTVALLDESSESFKENFVIN